MAMVGLVLRGGGGGFLFNEEAVDNGVGGVGNDKACV